MLFIHSFLLVKQNCKKVLATVYSGYTFCTVNISSPWFLADLCLTKNPVQKLAGSSGVYNQNAGTKTTKINRKRETRHGYCLSPETVAEFFVSIKRIRCLVGKNRRQPSWEGEWQEERDNAWGDKKCNHRTPWRKKIQQHWPAQKRRDRWELLVGLPWDNNGRSTLYFGCRREAVSYSLKQRCITKVNFTDGPINGSWFQREFLVFQLVSSSKNQSSV